MPRKPATDRIGHLKCPAKEEDVPEFVTRLGCFSSASKFRHLKKELLRRYPTPTAANCKQFVADYCSWENAKKEKIAAIRSGKLAEHRAKQFKKDDKVVYLNTHTGVYRERKIEYGIVKDLKPLVIRSTTSNYPTSALCVQFYKDNTYTTPLENDPGRSPVCRWTPVITGTRNGMIGSQLLPFRDGVDYEKVKAKPDSFKRQKLHDYPGEELFADEADEEDVIFPPHYCSPSPLMAIGSLDTVEVDIDTNFSQSPDSNDSVLLDWINDDNVSG
jgi:hypothetical protein